MLRFADCELDLDRRELRRDGRTVAVEPRVFALLGYLIEQRHRAVDKDEIQDAVWTGMIVSETALTRAIMGARPLRVRDRRDGTIDQPAGVAGGGRAYRR